MGRVLERNGTYLCSSCETMGILKVDSICGCGMRSTDWLSPAMAKRLPPGITGAYHCVVNPARTYNVPARIVIVVDGTIAEQL